MQNGNLDFHASISQYAFSTSTPITPLRRSPRKPVQRENELKNSKPFMSSPTQRIKTEVSTPLRQSPRTPSNQEVDPVAVTPSLSSKRKIKPEVGTSLGTPPKKKKRGYADPELYAHLNVLQDYLAEELDIMFCGINPGCLSAKTGHHFASPTNHFWRCLHRSGLTDRQLPPSEDSILPSLFCLGLTNLVDRPSAEEAELSTQEMANSVPALLAKIARFRPRIVCFVGRGIWVIVEKALKARFGGSSATPKSPGRRASEKTKAADKSANYGIQPYKFLHGDPNASAKVRETLFFVSPSSSGRVVSHQLPDKVKLFEQLRQNVMEHKASEIDTTAMLAVSL